MCLFVLPFFANLKAAMCACQIQGISFASFLHTYHNFDFMQDVAFEKAVFTCKQKMVMAYLISFLFALTWYISYIIIIRLLLLITVPN